MTHNEPAKFNLKKACVNCPFRKDAPKGVWDADHYIMLLTLVKADPEDSAFFCHQHRPDTVEACAGWAAHMRDYADADGAYLQRRIQEDPGLKTAIDAVSSEGIYEDVGALVSDNIIAMQLLEAGIGRCPMSLQAVPDRYTGRNKAVCPSCAQTLPIGDDEFPAHLHPALLRQHLQRHGVSYPLTGWKVQAMFDVHTRNGIPSDAEPGVEGE